MCSSDLFDGICFKAIMWFFVCRGSVCYSRKLQQVVNDNAEGFTFGLLSFDCWNYLFEMFWEVISMFEWSRFKVLHEWYVCRKFHSLVKLCCRRCSNVALHENFLDFASFLSVFYWFECPSCVLCCLI